MPNTEYEHAGNIDQLRDMQLGKMPRCNLCHFELAQITASTEIILSKVVLPDGTAMLFCQFCIEICRQVGDTDYNKAARSIRPLPAVCEAANQKALGYIAMAEKARAKVEGKAEAGKTPAKYFQGTGTVTIKDKDGNLIVLGGDAHIVDLQVKTDEDDKKF
jgi:hypothetical protein